LGGRSEACCFNFKQFSVISVTSVFQAASTATRRRRCRLSAASAGAG